MVGGRGNGDGRMMGEGVVGAGMTMSNAVDDIGRIATIGLEDGIRVLKMTDGIASDGRTWM
jgi:hypothetical protein